MQIYLDPIQRADFIARTQTSGPSGAYAVIVAVVKESSTSGRRPPITQDQSVRRSAVDVVCAENK